MKICLVKTSSMGDVLHALPALTDALHAIPDFRVDWVVEEGFAEIPRWHRAVNRVIPIALRRWRNTPFAADVKNEWKTYRTLLRTTAYDAVIDAQGLFKSAFFATRLARGVKHGYRCRCAREPVAAWFYDKKYTVDTQLHAVERIRRLFALSLGYTVPHSRGDYDIARHFPAVSSGEMPYVLFIHATTRDDKHWPTGEWKKTAQKLTALFDVEIRLPWGNAKEKQRAEQIADGIRNARVLPKLSLTELAAQIAAAKAVISVDTGLAHLAAALNKPNITLYGATDPNLIGTYGDAQVHVRCERMAAIHAETVLELLTEHAFARKVR